MVMYITIAIGKLKHNRFMFCTFSTFSTCSKYSIRTCKYIATLEFVYILRDVLSKFASNILVRMSFDKGKRKRRKKQIDLCVSI